LGVSASAIIAIQTFSLVMFRLLAVFLLAPVLSVRGVPAQVKLGFAFCLTLALWPSQAAALGAPLSLIQVGFRASSVMNPLTSLPASELDQIYFLLASGLFLIVGGDHALIVALSRTFDTFPAGAGLDLAGAVAPRLTALTSSAIVAGITIALPVLAITVTLDISLALLSRAVPQIQVFFIGIPIKFGLGLAALLVALPSTVLVLKRVLGDMPQQIAWLLASL
jgi:flagellar biosynthetic protein FliR